MPSNAPIVINDGASTPVAHTFKPVSVVDRLATWQETVSGVPVGFPKLSVNIKAPSDAETGAYTVSLKLTQPKVIQVTDTSGKTVNTVDYTNLADLTFKVSGRSSAQERVDIRTLLINALDNDIIVSAIEDLEGVY